MCGIVGIVNLDPRETVDEALLKRMRDGLRHRGPDGEGLWAEGPVGFGHRRLAIVDVAGGQQPMPNEDESCWIVYNGEIYNHAALRPGLEARGHRYRTRSDTETIVHLYEEEQELCVERLRGMFAFALWDRARERLLLACARLVLADPAGGRRAGRRAATRRPAPRPWGARAPAPPPPPPRGPRAGRGARGSAGWPRRPRVSAGHSQGSGNARHLPLHS